MDIYLDKVTADQKSTLFNLLQYSLFEESATDGNEIGEDGTFAYKYFDRYFIESDRLAFFIREKDSDKLLGFAMINTYMQHSESGHSIAEFMILPKYRHQKIGKKAAFLCFGLFDGNWEVSPSLGSESAFAFWKKVISEYSNDSAGLIDGVFCFRQ